MTSEVTTEMTTDRSAPPAAAVPPSAGEAEVRSWPPPSDRESSALPEDAAAEDPEVGKGRNSDGAGRPVAIDVGPPHEEALQRWVEGVLGWQVVDRQTSNLVPPTVHLVGATADPPHDGVPRILVLDESADPSAVLAVSRRLQPAAGIVWPRQRDDLRTVVRQVVALPRSSDGDRHLLRIGGVAGGVGTTTVALAVAGLGAWSGVQTFATVRGDAPASDLPIVAADAIAAVDLWARLEPLPGVPRCRAVRIADPVPAVEPRDPGIGLAVFDQGVDTDTDVVVCRRDAAALERLPGTTAAVVVVADTGPVPLRDLRHATGGRPAILLPWSARVARAGLQRRVPGSLPGAWLRRLLPLLPDHDGAGARASGTRSQAGPSPPKTARRPERRP